MNSADVICNKIINILDYCYKLNPEDDLGGLLGAICENVVVDGRVDEALFMDMNDFVEQCEYNGSIVFLSIMVLQNYHKLYGFNFDKTIYQLNHLPLSIIRNLTE